MERTAQINAKKQNENSVTRAKDDQNIQDNCTSEAKKVHGFRGKQFVLCNSSMTDLYEVSHIKILYRCAVVCLYMLSLRVILDDILSGKIPTFGLDTAARGFSDIHVVILMWIFMFVVTLANFYAFSYWATKRIKISEIVKNGMFLKIWDLLWFAGIIVYCFIIIYIPLSLRGISLAIGCNTILGAEQLRFLMKTHAFIRSNVPNILAYNRQENKDDHTILPKFSEYLYYLFAPTLIYRSSYPRNDKIRWNIVLLNILELIAASYMIGLTSDIICDQYREFGLKPDTWRTLVSYMFKVMVITPLFLVSGWYLMLHAWMNFAAEILRFADRRFYGEWWTSINLNEYYRNWNTVIYDYLHEYIYKDIVLNLAPGNRILGSCIVILLSGVLHEYFMFVIFGFVLPIMFFNFVILGLPLSLIRMDPAAFNYIMIHGLICGNASIIHFFAMEYFARVNCPKAYESVWDYFHLRIFTCKDLI